jgi:hypothetical protein
MRRWDSNTGMDVREIFLDSGRWKELARDNGFLISGNETSEICCHSTGYAASSFKQYGVWVVFRRFPVRICVGTPTSLIVKSFVVRYCCLLHFHFLLGLLFGCEDGDDILLRNVVDFRRTIQRYILEDKTSQTPL